MIQAVPAVIPLSLYVHIPWCERKCPYCDFNSHQVKAAIDENAYVAALIQDLEADLRRYAKAIAERPLQSIFIGGGTPSLFSADSIRHLLDAIAARTPLAPGAEITIEANPGSSEVNKFTGFREAGVNRLSIGVQSFNAGHLQALGRVHSAAEAAAAAGFARQAGFENFNLDLMYGLPHQDFDQCIEDIDRALEAGPAHLSCYQLTIEPNTLFHHQPPVRADEDELWKMQLGLEALVSSAGFAQYEVSAYAQQGRQCQHNLNYWQFGDYLAIGAGAHGKISSADGVVQRYRKAKHPAAYLAAGDDAGFTAGLDTLSPAQLAFEFMLNALRLRDGFDTGMFSARTGQDIGAIQQPLDRHQQMGLIKTSGNRVWATGSGRRFLDTLLQAYLPE